METLLPYGRQKPRDTGGGDPRRRRADWVSTGICRSSKELAIQALWQLETEGCR